MYYQDNRFKKRAWLPAPDTHEEQKKELLLQPTSEWFTLQQKKVLSDTDYLASGNGFDPEEGQCEGGCAPGLSLDEKQMDLERDVLRQNEVNRHDENEQEREDFDRTIRKEEHKKHTRLQQAVQKQTVDRSRVIEFGSNNLGGGDMPL